MTLRVFVDVPLAAEAGFALPDEAARHVQVCRLQPGDALVLFDGAGGEWVASVTAMGRREVSVQVGAHVGVTRERAQHCTIALGMPANERMDALIEKATELGVAAIRPLLTERSVLKLGGERAERRVAHWRAVAIGAAEQCGRTRVPTIEPIESLAAWLGGLAAPLEGEVRQVMSTGDAPALAAAVGRVGNAAAARRWVALSGPEGGLSMGEELAAKERGFAPVSLGERILRADTAPLVWLAQIELLLAPR